MSAGLQTLLQVFAQREVLTDGEVVEVLKAISKKIASGQSTDVDNCVKQINRFISISKLEIRGYHSPDKQRIFALINLMDDDMAKTEGAKLNPAEASILRSIFSAVAEADDYKCSIGELEHHRSKMTAAKFENLMEDLADHRWLTKVPTRGEPLFTFGPRAFTELAAHLRTMNVDVPQQIILTSTGN